MDFRWMSKGGLLLDGSGDIALCADADESYRDMIRTRLKAALDGWKLYQIGADLERLVGDAIEEELELTICRNVERVLTTQLFPSGAVQVSTLPIGDGGVEVYVYLNGDLAAQATVTAGDDATLTVS